MRATLIPKQKRGLQRRDTIIKSAAEVFLEKGYEHTSVDAILARSGGSRRNIYEWFGNKDALFAAVVEHLCDDLLISMSAHELNSDDPEETLRKFGRVFVKTLVSPPVIALYRLVIAESYRFPELSRVFYDAAPGAVISQMANFLTLCNDRGTLKVENPDLTARILVEMMKGDLHLKAVIDPHARITRSIPATVDHAIHVAIHGLKP